MHLPRFWSTPLVAVFLAVLAASAALAAERPRKPIPTVARGVIGNPSNRLASPRPGKTRPIRITPGLSASAFRMQGVAPACTTGGYGDDGSIVNFIYPPDDAFWTLLKTSDCATCVDADTLFFSKVHITLEFPTGNCPMPIMIGLVASRPDPPCATFPNPSNVLMTPEIFDLAPEPGRVQVFRSEPQDGETGNFIPAPGDTAEYIFTLSEPAKVPREAFLVFTFIDTVTGCADTASRPLMVMSDEDCRQCVSYNDWIGDINPDDMCFPDPIGNPLVYADVDSCPNRDFIPPGPVADLIHDAPAVRTVQFSWTASGDDGPLGQATKYDFRRSTARIDDNNFAAADTITGEPPPRTSGLRDTVLVTGLNENTHYYFALKVLDEAGNMSPVSNLDSAMTMVGIPNPIVDLSSVATTDTSARLRWTATGDDANQGRPLRYLFAVSTSPITASSFDAALRDSMGATVDAGNIESYEVRRLVASTDYWFAIKARDDIGNLSTISNVIMARTQVSGPFNSGPAIASKFQPTQLPVEFFWMGTGPGAPSQKIRIYDLAGRLVRTLPLSDDTSGIETWDGKNDDGESVPAGIYIARLNSGSKEAGTRVVLLR